MSRHKNTHSGNRRRGKLPGVGLFYNVDIDVLSQTKIATKQSNLFKEPMQRYGGARHPEMFTVI